MFTLLKPFDGFVWTATCALLCVQTTVLIIIRKIGNSVTPSRRFENDHFKGIEKKIFTDDFTGNFTLFCWQKEV